MRCSKCGSSVAVAPDAYHCNCAKIPKTIAGRPLSPAEAAQLFGPGATDVLSGFVSRAGKMFSCRLVLQGGKTVFDFPDRGGSGGALARNNSSEVFIRVESFHSGTGAFYISGPLKKAAELSFGLVPSRQAECLALITALKYVRHSLDGSVPKAKVSLNNLDLSRYLLRERKPRDQEVRRAVEYALGVLDGFISWSAEFKPRQRPRLRGGTAESSFPRGVFPWLNPEIFDLGSEVEIRLPDDPAVAANFRASVRSASGDGGVFRVPAAAGKVVRAWVASVKNTESTK